MIPMIIPLATQVAADFGVGWIVHGGTKMLTCMSEMGAAKKVCVGIAEVAITGIVSEKVNDYIDDTFDKAAEFIVRHDIDKKFKKGGGKNG